MALEPVDVFNILVWALKLGVAAWYYLLLVMLGVVLWMHSGGGLGPARHRSLQHAP